MPCDSSMRLCRRLVLRGESCCSELHVVQRWQLLHGCRGHRHCTDAVRAARVVVPHWLANKQDDSMRHRVLWDVGGSELHVLVVRGALHNFTRFILSCSEHRDVRCARPRGWVLAPSHIQMVVLNVLVQVRLALLATTARQRVRPHRVLRAATVPASLIRSPLATAPVPRDTFASLRRAMLPPKFAPRGATALIRASCRPPATGPARRATGVALGQRMQHLFHAPPVATGARPA